MGNKVFTKAQFEEIGKVFKNVFAYVNTCTVMPPPDYYQWYAGITGQKDLDGDGCLDRKVGHEADYEEVYYWEEFPTSYMKIALAVETKLHDAGFDGRGDKNRKGNLTLEPDVVYVFKMGKPKPKKKS